MCKRIVAKIKRLAEMVFGFCLVIPTTTDGKSIVSKASTAEMKNGFANSVASRKEMNGAKANPKGNSYDNGKLPTQPSNFNINGSDPHPKPISAIYNKDKKLTQSINKASFPRPNHNSKIHSQGASWACPASQVTNGSVPGPNTITGMASPEMEEDSKLMMPLETSKTSCVSYVEDNFNDVEYIVCNLSDDGAIYVLQSIGGEGCDDYWRPKELSKDGEVEHEQTPSIVDAVNSDGEASFAYMVSRSSELVPIPDRSSCNNSRSSFAFSLQI